MIPKDGVVKLQMISVTNTNGKIIPLRFRFQSDDDVVSVHIDEVLQDNQDVSRVGISYVVAAELYGVRHQLHLYYSYHDHTWKMQTQHPMSIT